MSFDIGRKAKSNTTTSSKRNQEEVASNAATYGIQPRTGTMLLCVMKNPAKRKNVPSTCGMIYRQLRLRLIIITGYNKRIYA